MRLSLIWPCLFSLISASTFETTASATITSSPAPIQNRAIQPSVSGQIGINPWDDTPRRPVISYIDSHGQWKPTNSKYIDEVQTTTHDGKPATSTLSAPVAFMTGDNKMDLVMTPDLRTELVKIAKDVTPCKKRSASCGNAQFLERLESSDSDLIREVLRMTGTGSESVQNLIDYLELGVEGQVLESLVPLGVGGAVLYFFWKQFKPGDESIPLSVSVKGTKKPPQGSDDSGTDEDQVKCPKDAPTGKEAPICQECGATSNSKTCTNGKWNKCDCIMAAVGITVQQPGGWALDLSKVWNDAASSNGQLLDSQKPKVNCSSGYGDAVSLEKDWIEKLSKKFCSSGKNESVLGSMDIQSQQHSNTDVTFKIEPGEGCQADCEQGFQALFTECEGINSHTVQAKGKATVKECKALYQYEVAQGTTPDCDVGRASVIPANVFQKTPVWKHFCEHEDNSKDPRSMVVDVWGNRPTMLKRDGLQARTPPVTNLEGYDGKLFELSWKPNNQGLLSRNCSDAFHDMSQSQCGRAGSQQNNMAREGSVFVGSGTYSYKVKNEMYEVPLSAKKHFPWKDDGSQFGKPKKLGKDVYKDLWIRNACGLWNEILITPKKHLRDTGSTMWESPYTYTVFWKKDCKLEKDPQQQNMQDPRGDGSVSCKDAYKAAGGSIGNSYGGVQDYGCLRFAVIPSPNAVGKLTDADLSQSAGEY